MALNHQQLSSISSPQMSSSQIVSDLELEGVESYNVHIESKMKPWEE